MDNLKRRATVDSFARGKRWTPSMVQAIISNPIYVGIGPFTDGPDPFPQLIDDETWIRVQVLSIYEMGAKRHLQAMRKSVYKSIGFQGFKIAFMASEKWLDASVLEIKATGPEQFFRNLLSKLRPEQKAIELIKNEVQIVDVTSDLLKTLSSDPSEIYKLTPKIFEDLICDRLKAMGLGVERVGKGTYGRDGGVDIVAWPKHAPFPFLLAVQAKHHRSPQQKTGPQPIRDMLGVIHNNPFNAGVLVTNTSFTPDAQWFANQKPMLLRLRDIADIQRWLRDNFLDEQDWREVPTQIEICPGVVINLPLIDRSTVKAHNLWKPDSNA